MEKLLQIVNQKLQAGEVDVTLKFTLSALWNLTDESPTTCETFLGAGGLDLFVNLLNAEPFLNEASIETKVLGLLNNLAEVCHLRSQILRSDFINVLSFRLLSSEHIDVSYFAAGILSHLCSSEEWHEDIDVQRQTVLDELEKRSGMRILTYKGKPSWMNWKSACLVGKIQPARWLLIDHSGHSSNFYNAP